MPNMLKLAKNNNLEEPNWMGKIPNVLKFAKISQFLGISRFPGSSKIWKSEFKIKVSDQNWVGKIPNMLKLVKTSQIQRTSRFPDFQIPEISRCHQKLPKISVNMLQ